MLALQHHNVAAWGPDNGSGTAIGGFCNWQLWKDKAHGPAAQRRWLSAPAALAIIGVLYVLSKHKTIFNTQNSFMFSKKYSTVFFAPAAQQHELLPAVALCRQCVVTDADGWLPIHYLFYFRLADLGAYGRRHKHRSS
jgi:hypothetical protein